MKQFKLKLPKFVVRSVLDAMTLVASYPLVPKVVHRLLLRSELKGKGCPFEKPEYRFLARIVLDRKRSFSQIFQDLWVLFELENKHNGFFVEFGAADGVYLSNTYLLEKEYSWTGILAEPAPSWHKSLFQNRRNALISTKCISSKSGHSVTLRIPKKSAEYASIRSDVNHLVHRDKFQEYDIVQVETLSLLDLLKEYNAPKEIDYISIDVEGGEVDILRSFDFSQYKVRLFSIEHNSTKEANIIDSIMTANGYCRRFPQFSLFDGWYKLIR